jgi:hypothetical protein
MHSMASRLIPNQEYEPSILYSRDPFSLETRLRRKDKVFGCRTPYTTGWAIRRQLSNQTELFPYKQHHTEGK